MCRFASGALAWIVTVIILVACAGKPGGPIMLNVAAPQPASLTLPEREARFRLRCGGSGTLQTHRCAPVSATPPGESEET
jgi:hypothetical protein